MYNKTGYIIIQICVLSVSQSILAVEKSDRSVSSDIYRIEKGMVIYMSYRYHDALFFDIDGTIISEITHKIPPSAIHAIEQAGKNGCLTFINTGRTYFFVPNELKRIPFNGFLCGCGTHILANTDNRLQTLYHRQLPHRESLQIIETLQTCHIDGVLEGEHYSYFNKERSRFNQINEIRDSFLGNVDGCARFFDDPNICADKFVAWTDEQSDTKTFLDFAEAQHYQVIDRNNGFYEFVPENHSKATAITFILNVFDITKEHAYVFGDSANDLPMFTCVPNTIAMGVHDSILEPYTSFVTKTVEEDGIACALRHFGFID